MGKQAATIASCPSSTPRLNPSSDDTRRPRGRPTSASTDANPNPCRRPEREGHHPAMSSEHGPEVVDGRQHHRRGDGGLGEARRHGHHVQRRQRQRQRMRGGERGHRANDVRQRGPDRGDRQPGAAVATQDRRQQQGEQEQHVIQPAPDVAHALRDEGAERRAARCGAAAAPGQRPPVIARREQDGLGAAATIVDAQQAPVLRIGVEQQPVVDLQRRAASQAGSRARAATTRRRRRCAGSLSCRPPVASAQAPAGVRRPGGRARRR